MENIVKDVVVSSNQEIMNKFKIYKLIKCHFGLSKDSLKLFKYRLFYEPHIAPEYAKLLKDSKDLRIRAKIKDDHIDLLSNFDEGWRIFKDNFYNFYSTNYMSYQDFRNNLIKIGNQNFKIKKALVDFYTNKAKSFVKNGNNYPYNDAQLTLDRMDRTLEKIGKYKLGKKKNLELVFSLNFADWFLCSTEEDWSSCLSLDSDYDSCYWAGLSGLVGDKNRGFIYITDGKKKNYNGIIVDRVICRSWVLITRSKDADNNINFYTTREYPVSYDLAALANQLFNHQKIQFTKSLNTSGSQKVVSRYYSEFLYHIFQGKEISTSVYLDNCGAKIAKSNKAKYYPSSYYYYKIGNYGNVFYFEKNGHETNYEMFNYSGGLKNLISYNEKITEATEENYYATCEFCDENIRCEEDAYYVDGFTMCSSCHEDKVFYCECCDSERISGNEEVYIESEKITVCRNCQHEYYLLCEDCKQYINRDSILVIESSKEFICSSCLINSDRYAQCACCNEVRYSDEMKYLEEINEFYCEECYREILDKKQKKLISEVA